MEKTIVSFMHHGTRHSLNGRYKNMDAQEIREIYNQGDVIKFGKYDNVAHNKLHCISCDKVLATSGHVDEKTYICIADLPWCESCFKSDEGYIAISLL